MNYIQRMASVLENNMHTKKEWLAIDDTGWIIFNIFSGLLCIFQIFSRPAFPHHLKKSIKNRKKNVYHRNLILCLSMCYLKQSNNAKNLLTKIAVNLSLFLLPSLSHEEATTLKFCLTSGRNFNDIFNNI